jgi:hypothetical protein
VGRCRSRRGRVTLAVVKDRRTKRKRPPLGHALVAAAVTAGALAVLAASSVAADWPEFGVDPARTNASSAPTGIGAAQLKLLVRHTIPLDGTVDSSPIYLHAVTVEGGVHDVLVVTTSYGRTIALDARTGAKLWEFVPPGIARWEGSLLITEATPAADPDRRWVYAVSPDGFVHKLSLAAGTEATDGGWPVRVTLDPAHEKVGSAINVAGPYVIVTTGGHITDTPPYQGHVVTIARASGAIVHVFDALCSNETTLMPTTACPAWGAAIWGRAGAVVMPGTDDLLVATGNAPWDGSADWGDSVLELSPDAGSLIRAYTPTDYELLDHDDFDLGSTSPVALTPTLVVQGGKDGRLRLIDLARLPKVDVTGGEIQNIPTPRDCQLLTAPAVFHLGGETLMAVGDYCATAVYALVPKPAPHLVLRWQNRRSASSPVVAGGLMYVYDPGDGGIDVYRPDSPELLASLPGSPGHWTSPIVADGLIAVGAGTANAHLTTGTLDVYRLPGWRRRSG